MAKPENVRLFWEAAYIQYYLECQEFRLIYVDEFHLSLHSTSNYNWSKSGKPASLAIDSDPTQISFVIAVSDKKVEGILAWNISIKTESFWQFMRDVNTEIISTMEEPLKLWYIFDNSSVHTNKRTRIWLQTLGICCLSIPPYSAQLNWAERIIAVIKNKARQESSKGKIISLGLIQDIVEGISDKTCKEWTKSTRVEILCKLETFKVQV